MELEIKMKNLFKKLFVIFIIFCSLFFITSCATTIRTNVTRPAKLDLNGAETISVLPFASSGFNSTGLGYGGASIVIGDFFDSFINTSAIERQVLNYLQANIENGLVKSPYIEVINSAVVNNALKLGKRPPVDVYLTGEMITFNVYDKEKVQKRVLPQENDDDDKKNQKPIIVYDKSYSRDVLLVFNYQIVDSFSNKVISFDTIKIEESSGFYDDKDSLPEVMSMIQYDLDGNIDKLLKDLQPYTISKSISLMEDKSKNPQMKLADKLAKDGYFKESYNEFLKVYREHNQLEAGYNAAMILMAMGELNQAENLMAEICEKFNNSKAYESLYDIRNEIKQSEILNNQIKN